MSEYFHKLVPDYTQDLLAEGAQLLLHDVERQHSLV
jgi:hypothetical protein